MTDTRLNYPISNPVDLDRIIAAAAAVDDGDFRRLSRGDDVADLSSHTAFDGLALLSGGILQTGPAEFEASATVYVTLQYGSGDDALSTPDSYPAIVRGTIGEDGVEITAIEVDTSGFYA